MNYNNGERHLWLARRCFHQSSTGCYRVSTIHSLNPVYFQKSVGRSTRLITLRRNSRFGLSDGTGAAPITGAPAAHCCYMTAHRLEEYTVSPSSSLH